MEEKRFVYETEEYKYYLVPENEEAEGAFFVNHEKTNNRGGHFGHAMVECPNGDIIAWYPNCNADNNGHSGRGWMEYKRSSDKGITWTEAKPFPYSKTLWDLNLGMSIINEKSIVADDGTIILFNLVCDVARDALWEPYFEPTYITSTDGGYTWSEPKVFNEKYGRIYDAHVKDGNIYVLSHLEGKYYISVSSDGGETFKERKNTVPAPARSYYGTMGFLKDGSMIVYTYSESDETVLNYSISENRGTTWSGMKTAKFEKCIRNPQFIELNGAYFIMGRSGSLGSDAIQGHNIIYCSNDGIRWDSGTYLSMRTAGIGAYSNAIIVGSFNMDVPNRVLYQASKAYHNHLTNIHHWWIDAYLVEN